jgi:hypothetical protein
MNAMIIGSRLVGMSSGGVLAQADVKSMFASGMGIIMMIGFFIGTILIISGAWQIKQGNADQGKLSIVGGIIIAAAVSIMSFFFQAGGLDDGAIDPEF